MIISINSTSSNASISTIMMPTTAPMTAISFYGFGIRQCVASTLFINMHESIENMCGFLSWAQ